MKILFLAHRVPYPPNKGDKIRSYHELRAMFERGHEVYLLAFADDPADLKYQASQHQLAQWCASVEIVPLNQTAAKLRALARIVTGTPLSLGYFSSGPMRRAVKRAISARKFDAVFVYSSTMAQYVPAELFSRSVADLVDVDSEKWRDYAARTGAPKSWLYRIEARRLRAYEYWIVSRFARTFLTTNREAALLNRLDEFTRRAKLRVMTNGVDLDFFQPQSQSQGQPQGQPQEMPAACEPQAPRLVFVGAMDYYANVEAVQWFVDKVWPLIRNAKPDAEFFIVGSKPTAQVLKLDGRNGVTVTGFVEDVRPFLHGSTACVVPLRIARGVQNKVLEAMAAGKAIIATPEAAAGLAVNGEVEQVRLAGTAPAFAAAAIEVINDQILRASLGQEARWFVEAHHDWQPLLQRLIEQIEALGSGRAAQQPRNNRSMMMS